MNLKPLDPEAAKAGQKICWKNTREAVAIEYVAYDGHRDVCVRYDGGQLTIVQQDQLAMKPLGFCEDRPVYPGDVLYTKNGGFRYDVSETISITKSFEPYTWTPPRKPLCVIDGVEMFGGETVWHKSSGNKYIMQDVPHMFGYPAQFTLTPPKKKKVLSLWRLLDGTIMTAEPVYRIKDAIKLRAVGVTDDNCVEVQDGA